VTLQDACCGQIEACTQRHLYCFNRNPKEADVAAMSTFEQDKITAVDEKKAFDAAFDAARASVQQSINAATHGSAPVARLPTDSKARKETPICTGVLDYFPKALAEIARLSKAGNDKHNPGQPLHWAREKSTDHADCIIRHMLERGSVDEFGFLHEVSVAWRALAQLEVALEKPVSA
jgi:hypothetical protein